MSEIGDFLSASAEAAYAAFQSRLLPGVSNIVGVRMPLIRRYVKQALKDGRWRDWPEMDAGAPYEEIMIRGLVLAQADLPFDEHTRVMEAFLQRIDNWGVCDSVCASCRFLRGDRVAAIAGLRACWRAMRNSPSASRWSACAIILRGSAAGRSAFSRRRVRQTAENTTMPAWRLRGCWPRRRRPTRAL